MVFCMKTTLNLDNALMQAVKQRTLDTGRTITTVIEDAIRDTLLREQAPAQPYRLQWPTIRGRLLPGMELTDRHALYDRMEGRPVMTGRTALIITPFHLRELHPIFLAGAFFQLTPDFVALR